MNIEVKDGDFYRVTRIDDEDYDKVSIYHWYLVDGYVKTTFQGKTINILDIIKGKKEGFQYDHIDRDKLNNQKENIKYSTNLQNILNRGLHKNNTSGYKGVTWCKAYKYWRAKIKVGNRRIHLGSFSTKEAAAIAYNEASLQYYGQDGYQNIIEDK